jgi:hypothetical protein
VTRSTCRRVGALLLRRQKRQRRGARRHCRDGRKAGCQGERSGRPAPGGERGAQFSASEVAARTWRHRPPRRRLPSQSRPAGGPARSRSRCPRSAARRARAATRTALSCRHRAGANGLRRCAQPRGSRESRLRGGRLDMRRDDARGSCASRRDRGGAHGLLVTVAGAQRVSHQGFLIWRVVLCYRAAAPLRTTSVCMRPELV